MFRLNRLKSLATIFNLLLVLAPFTTASVGRSWTLYHAIVDGISEPEFTVRGQVTLSLKDPNEVSTKKDKKLSAIKGKDTDSPFRVELQHTEEKIPPDFMQQILKENAFYQLKLVPNDSRSAPSILSTVPACQLRRANFRDEFVVTLGSDAQAISMTYIPLVSPLAPASCSHYEAADHDKDFVFHSRLSAETTVPGMTLKTILPDYQPPPGLTFLKGAHLHVKEAMGDQKPGQEQDNSFPYGFMRRYWYILLPLFLMNFMSAGPPPEQGGAEGASEGTPTAGAGAPKRRGKRD
ncbi:hypothetical protein FisN_18Hh206 [Fistulifera solaris]|uniref:Uncharacterized protein n=1 Tax=Fistulifera solaris TaxID=1519565 RepID=A0A1Z5JVB8_FISSO|nr:hypothetical protein FisN_18Hh206 [Fistulifera solaris]|eukprot:GAX17993.1 hypothetical protein FisN_18Hh206 [Fistulifera solaris]